MYSSYIKRIVIDVLLFMATAVGLYYLFGTHLDFLISLFHFNSANVCSVAYSVMRVLFVLQPLVMLSRQSVIRKTTMLKCSYIIIGVCYLLGNTWLINFLVGRPLQILLTASIPTVFAGGELAESVADSLAFLENFQSANALNFNYLVWDSYDLFAVVFSLVQGILYIYLGLCIEQGRRRVVRIYAITFALALLLPLAYTFGVRLSAPTSLWSTKNLFVLTEQFIVLIALFLAMETRSLWIDTVWH